MNFLSHAYPPKQGNTCDIAGVNRCVDSTLLKRTQEVIEHGDDSFASIALALVCRRNGEAKLRVSWIVCAEKNSDVADEPA